MPSSYSAQLGILKNLDPYREQLNVKARGDQLSFVSCNLPLRYCRTPSIAFRLYELGSIMSESIASWRLTMAGDGGVTWSFTRAWPAGMKTSPTLLTVLRDVFLGFRLCFLFWVNVSYLARLLQQRAAALCYIHSLGGICAWGDKQYNGDICSPLLT